jgi:TonB family protein
VDSCVSEKTTRNFLPVFPSQHSAKISLASTAFMMLLRAIVVPTVLCVLSGGAAAAEDIQKTADGMLDRARQLSDIRSPNAPGFRLNLTFSFTGHDLETLQGTYTEVWISNSQWRRETTVGNFRRIEIGGPTRRWLVDGGQDFPEEAERLSTLVEMFPAGTAKFEFESVTEPDSATQCFVTNAVGEQHRRHAFCFDKDNKFLVENVAPQSVGERIADYSCSYNRFRKFGNYWFPRDMACFQDGHRKIEAQVVDLSPAPSPDAALFTPPVGAVEIGNCSANSVPPQRVTSPGPMPPLGMRDHQSSVLLWMIVDTKGKPQDLKIARSGGKQFDDSALAAIRSWRFKPGTCNGEPMPLPISVAIMFTHYSVAVCVAREKCWEYFSAP